MSKALVAILLAAGGTTGPIAGLASKAAVSVRDVSRSSAQTSAATIGTDTWTPLRFLLGRWEGTTGGQPGNGTARREYRLTLRDRFIEVRNVSSYPPQERNLKGETHEDIGYISDDGGRRMFVLRQFHVEGFVNTYVAGGGDSTRIVFTTETIENLPAGWRARETYLPQGTSEFEEIFELAEPGKDFELYSRARFKRVP